MKKLQVLTIEKRDFKILIKNKKKQEKTSVIDFEKIDKTEILKIKKEFSNLIDKFKK